MRSPRFFSRFLLAHIYERGGKIIYERWRKSYREPSRITVRKTFIIAAYEGIKWPLKYALSSDFGKWILRLHVRLVNSNDKVWERKSDHLHFKISPLRSLKVSSLNNNMALKKTTGFAPEIKVKASSFDRTHEQFLNDFGQTFKTFHSVFIIFSSDGDPKNNLTIITSFYPTSSLIPIYPYAGRLSRMMPRKNVKCFYLPEVSKQGKCFPEWNES